MKASNRIRKITLAVIMALGLFGLYEGLDYFKEKEFESLKKEFPSYVTKLKDEYGKLDVELRLVYLELPFYICGKARSDSVIINDTFLNYMLEPEKEKVVIHEISHFFVEKYLKGTDQKLLFTDGYRYGRWYATNSDKGIAKLLIEGCTEYLTKEQCGKISTLDYIQFYNFVKPVMDELGVENGIKRLFLEPPKLEELDNSGDYYKRIGIKQTN